MIKTYNDYLEALETSTTEMFWFVPSDVVVSDDFKFDICFDYDNEYDRHMNHVFLNGERYDGIMLMSKHKPISRREFENRFLVERKEWNIVASRPKLYDKFTTCTFDDYLEALETSTTEMFWIVPSDVAISEDFKFDIRFNYDNKYDRHMNHVFLNGERYDGIMLMSKHRPITRREFENRFLVERKEWNIVASCPKQYDKFTVYTFSEYRKALETSTTELFWIVPNDVVVSKDFKFDIRFEHDNKYDRHMNHIFLNGEHYDGIMLMSKHRPITRREFDSRFLAERKEWSIVASRPKQYDKFTISSYTDYLTAVKKSKTTLFWAIWNNIEVVDKSVFDLYFSHYNFSERNENHVFKNLWNREESFYNGLLLLSKNKLISKREFEARYLIDKKEYFILASKLKPYDIVFISYNEPNADENYKSLLEKFPRAKRVHGVKGIHQAHIEAAKQVSTDMFWVVDGDAQLDDTFQFDFEVSRYEMETVHVWSSQNPINNLIYGYGGVKLLPTKLSLNIDVASTDMTTSISSKFKVVTEVSNVTVFNTDPFNTWKSAFRECVKLASQSILRQEDSETQERLHAWTTVGRDKKFGEYSILGAKQGKEYGTKYKDDQVMLSKINDFDWLFLEFAKLNE